MNCHIRSSASAASSPAIRSTTTLRRIANSSTRSRRFCESMNARDRLIVVSRFRTSLASSAVPSAPASSSRSNRRATGLLLLISISSSTKRSAPRASRFLAFRARLVAVKFRRGNTIWLRLNLIRRSESRNSWDRPRQARDRADRGKAHEERSLKLRAGGETGTDGDAWRQDIESRRFRFDGGRRRLHPSTVRKTGAYHGLGTWLDA